MVQVVFWTSIGFVVYAYLGYPLLLMVLSVFVRRPVRRGAITPTVSFVITAYNEEKRIRDKIENTLKQDYPKARLEIIVASDCSSDGTDEIVRSYQSEGIRLVRASERRGKEYVQKLAVATANGEILVFSDVATILQPAGVSNIVKNFDDPTIGCVSSTDRFIDAGGAISGEGVYIRYEMFLRKLETKVNSLVSLSGSFFAARREVCRNWAVDLQSDFNTLLNAVRMGLRGVLDPDSVGYYRNIADERKEFERKVRTVVRGISVFMTSLSMLNPIRYSLFSWQLFSHKLCRWLVPFALILAFISNAVLLPVSKVYLYAFVIQIGFYATAVGGVKIPSFFVLVNLSILNAWYLYVRGERMVRWNPSER
jgi:glycosyltransferase involved in cell wall biosynthesis